MPKEKECFIHNPNWIQSVLGLQKLQRIDIINVWAPLILRGIEASNSVADIKKAYRKAALRHHLDKVHAMDNLQLFLVIKCKY